MYYTENTEKIVFNEVTMNFSIISNPKRIFLIDAIGALLTASFLFLMNLWFSDEIGMPRVVLFYLSLTALVYCIYSCCCFISNPKKWKIFLSIIIFANIFYCCLTFGLMLRFCRQLTVLGLVYFVAEILIILALVLIEIRLVRSFDLKFKNELL